MTAPVDGGAGLGRPRAVVLAARWSGNGEAAWFTRQVARALARCTDVHVVTLEGEDGVAPSDDAWSAPSTMDAHAGAAMWTVHRLDAAPPRGLVARREVLLTALSATEARSGRPNGPSMERLLRHGTAAEWSTADEVVRAIRPDLVVLADYRQVGALELCERVAPDVPLVVIPLADTHPAVDLAQFDPIFDRASAVLVATDAECQAVVERPGADRSQAARVHRVGLPIVGGANDAGVGASDAGDGRLDPAGVSAGISDGDPGVMVFTGCSADSHDRPAALARLVALAFPRTTVTVAAIDASEVWRGGVPTRGAPFAATRGVPDLMTGAAVTLDLRPGTLFARRCIESLLRGTPIVVPADSRARQHAELGGAGLWFGPPGELIWCVEAMVDAEVRSQFGVHGKRYAEERFGSVGFVDVVTAVIDGLTGGGAGTGPRL